MSTMRIGGLASGMDIDSIVEKLMVAERMPMDKLEQQKQIYEWQRDAYRDVNKKMTTLDTYIADNFILKSLNTKTATSSNSDLVSAVATGSASGSLTLESVSQLAKAARGIGTPINHTSSTKLKDLFKEPGETLPTNFTLSAINTQGKLGEEISIVIDENITIGELITKINGSNAGVSVLFENGQVSITAKNTGKVVEEDGVGLKDAITTNSEGTKLFAKLGLEKLVTEKGQNAEFQVNGITTERTSNSFSINGYNVTLKAKFSENPVTMSSSTNVDEIMTKVKEFVSTYNGFIKDLTDQTKQPKYRDYQPLTELQKKEMDTKDIENWETRAKSGLLRNDSIITSGLSSLRGLVYETNHAVTNQKYNALYTIGIGTSKDYMSGGTLEIDETKLRKALEEDPDAVVQLLTMNGEKSASITKADGSTGTGDTRGFMRKIRDEMDVIEKKIDERAGRGSMTETQYTLGKYLRNVNQSLDAWKDKLIKIEDRYWKQFGAMEAMINKANSQSASLMSQYY
ncbi:flagellar filament capping protein FliD [Solibacillus sp. FSL W7-1464]|uniref:flagellar filament capping protein FliD n=1 Tax=Solibacillus sp. FSL W7-1464 TaxID=2921706 RepID=UPI0030F844AA